jgi:hypothetical protein
MVHGLGRGFGWIGKLHRYRDWTDGCVAVTNNEMAELWRGARRNTHRVASVTVCGLTRASSGRCAVRWQVQLSFRWIGFGTWRHRAAEGRVRWTAE